MCRAVTIGRRTTRTRRRAVRGLLGRLRSGRRQRIHIGIDVPDVLITRDRVTIGSLGLRQAGDEDDHPETGDDSAGQDACHGDLLALQLDSLYPPRAWCGAQRRAAMPRALPTPGHRGTAPGSLGHSLGLSLGDSLGSLGDSVGSLGDSLGSLGDSLGSLGLSLGDWLGSLGDSVGLPDGLGSDGT